MASYTSQRGPNGGPISPNYPHQLPAPGHPHGSYSSSQPLPAMTPSNNANGYGGQNYPQSQPYQHPLSSYPSQQSHPPPHPQAYHQPPPPGPSQHALPSPTSIAPPQPSPGPSQAVSKMQSVSTVVGGRRFSMIVEQQPIRARMCGFGDKDRRPLTPPPAIRLIVEDVKTGQEVDVNTIDYAQYVVTVDLWDEIGSKEVNLVRSTTATPAISSTIHESFNNLETMPFRANIAPYPPSHPAQTQMYGQPQAAVQQYGGAQYGQVSNYQTAPSGYGQPQYGYSTEFSPVYRPPQVYEGGSMGGPQRLSMSGASGAPVQGMFTRNLIGNCAGSAFRLHDTNDKIGIWFVMQDLSVRTEGAFRLRFSFVDVKPKADQKGDAAVKTGKSPILASVFSDVFQVYSAKKFPGVCDSTDLSKCFATQGIKIPIRKEGGKGGDDNDDDDE